MSDVDKARREWDFVEAQQVLADLYPMNVLEAFDTCIREIARDEFAKLSPAPVGREWSLDFVNRLAPTPPACKCGAFDAFDHSPECVAEYDAWKAAQSAPTPPAERSDGGDRLPPMRRSYIDGTNPPQFKPDPNGPYVLWDDAAATIADLEQRLAEANHTVNRLDLSIKGERDRAEAAKRDLAEARKREKRIRAAGQQLSNMAYNLAQMPRLCDQDRKSLREGCEQWDAALLPTEDGTKDGRGGRCA